MKRANSIDALVESYGWTLLALRHYMSPNDHFASRMREVQTKIIAKAKRSGADENNFLKSAQSWAEKKDSIPLKELLKRELRQIQNNCL
jgi:hypothetical protein